MKSGIPLGLVILAIGSYGISCFLVQLPLGSIAEASSGPCDRISPSGSSGITESLPPESIGENCVAFQWIIHPSLISFDNSAPQQEPQNVSTTLRLYDPFNNQTFSHTTSRITITRINNDKTIFDDIFHSHGGLLTLNFLNNKYESGNKYQRIPDLQNAILAPQNGTVDFTTVFATPGLYHFQVQVLGLNKDELFSGSSGENSNFSSWLSARSVYNQTISYGNHNYDTSAISYYDRIDDFSFESRSKTFYFSMPFNWNTTFIKDNNIFVHEELLIPKSFSVFFNGTGDYASIIFEEPPFNATVNGISIKGRNLAIDPYTYPDYVTFHYLLNKNDLANMSASIPSSDKRSMNLTLSSHPVIKKTTNTIETDTGGIMVNLDWKKNLAQPPESNNWTVSIDFADSISGKRIEVNVLYDLVIFDSNNNEVYGRSNLTAQGGKDEQTIEFPKNEGHTVEIRVTGLSYHDGESTTIDHTRNGTAKGVVVVPEFGSVDGVLIAAASLAFMVVGVRFARNRIRG